MKSLDRNVSYITNKLHDTFNDKDKGDLKHQPSIEANHKKVKSNTSNNKSTKRVADDIGMKSEPKRRKVKNH